MKTPAQFKTIKVMTFATVQHEHKRLQDFIRSTDEENIILDMSSIEQCDSAGLALMLEAKRLAQSSHKSCEYQAVPEMVWNLARFCGIESIFLSTD